ncbi:MULTISPECIES: hypothetical protein [Sphingomonas]|jgi:hypothetical protein|uniref:hypothetical protein n=1 Tax=Sphingomonas TaxID=13687 RepID=UPI001AE194FB
MIITVFVLMAASVSSSAAKADAICEVGRVALQDLPSTNRERSADLYYAGHDAERTDVLEVCPKLVSEIPAGYPLADRDARARANMHVPIAGQAIKAAFIYSIEVPEIGADLKTATVRMDVSCTGLCGSGFEAHYIRTAKGWKRQGDIRTLFVS